MALFLPNYLTSVYRNIFSIPADTIHTFKLSKGFILCLLLIVVGLGELNATTYTAKKSGNWNDISVWGAVPTLTDDVVIPNNFTVTMDANPGNCNSLELDGSGSLNWSGSGTLNIAGNWIQNGSNQVTPGAGTINFTGNNSSIIKGTSTNIQVFNNITISKSPGQTLSLEGSMASLQLNGNITINSGSFAPGTILTVVSGNWTNNGGTLAITGTIKLNGSGKTIGGTSSTLFNNLNINNNAGGILLGIDQFINGTLTLENGLLKLGAYNLTLGASSPDIAGNFYNFNLIVANGSGQLRKIFTSSGSYTFPIGDNTYYSPIKLDFGSGAFASGAYAGVNVTNAKHLKNTSPTNYLTRYWSVSQSGISSFSCTVTGNYPNSYGDDVVGQQYLSTVVEYDGHMPWISYPAVLSNNTLTATGVTTFGDFTGMGLLTLNTTVSSSDMTPLSSLDGFTYIHNYGPSLPPKTFSVTALNTSNDVIVTAPADFEISLSWSGVYGSSLTLAPSNGNVNQTIYVQLKKGLAVGNYSNENIVCTTKGLNPVNVLLTNASVTAPTDYGPIPTGDGSKCSITLVYIEGINNTTAKPAGYNDYTLTNSTDLVLGATYKLIVNVNTDGANTVGAKAWIDWNNGGFTSNSYFKTYDLGTANNVTDGKTYNCPIEIKVPLTASLGKLRMRIACLKGRSPDNVTDNSSEVEDYTLNIVAPTINVIATLNGFNYPFGSGPSSEKTFTVGGTYLTENLVVTPPMDYEISLTSGSSFVAMNQISLTPTNKTVPTTTIYVRLKAGLPAGNYPNENIDCSSNVATPKKVVCSGTVIDNYHTVINAIPSTLSGFAYNYGGGPSAEKTFTVSGVNLSSNLNLTPPAEYEISQTSGASFVATNPISLAPTNGTVSTTTIYVRLKAGLAIGNYTGKNIVCSSTDVVNQNVTVTVPVSGSVSFATYYSRVTGDWNVYSTWSYTSGGLPVASGVYPQAGDIVNIEKGYTVTSTANAACASLNFSAPTTQLKISPATSLTVSGTITTVSTDNIYIQSSTSAANGSLIFHNDQNTPVYGTVEMNSLATISGSVVLDKYHWQYFGIPVQQVTASPTFDNAYVRQWNEAGTLTSNNYWVTLNNGSSLIPFTGYEICQTSSRIYQIKGKLVNSDFIKYSVTSPGIVLPYTTNAAYSGQNIFANPYTAAIDINKLYFGEGTEKTVYLYNTGTKKNWSDNSGGSTNGIKAGQYKSVPQGLATAISDPTIPSMQGFLIKAMANTSNVKLPNAYFSITYSSVVTPNTSALRAPASEKNDSSRYVFTKIDVTGTNSYDQLWLFTVPTCTHSFDNGWDGHKLMGPTLTTQLFAMEEDGIYQVNSVNDMNNTYLGFQPGEDKQYTLTFKNENLGKYYSNVYLLDLAENRTMDITPDSSKYTFTAVPFAPQTKRFKIVTIPVLKDTNTAAADIQLFSSERTIFVNNFSKTTGNLAIYDISGRLVKKILFGANCITPIQTSFPGGVYIVKATTPTFELSNRIILQ